MLPVQCVNRLTKEEAGVMQKMQPAPVGLSSNDSLRYTQSWLSGMHLYKNNCSSCHGIFGKKQADSVLNFTFVQFHNYRSAFLAGDSLNHAVVSKMTAEELNNVFLFLVALKRN